MTKSTAHVIFVLLLFTLLSSYQHALAGRPAEVASNMQSEFDGNTDADFCSRRTEILVSVMLEIDRKIRELESESEISPWHKSSVDPQAYFPLAETVFTWNGVSWSPVSRTTHTYTGNKLSTSTTEWFDGLSWANQSRTVNTYTGGNLTQTLEQSWTGSAWQDTTRFVITYDGSNRMATSEFDEWNGSSWDMMTLTTYTYDGSSRVSTVTIQNHDGSGWVNDGRSVYTYNGAGKVSKLLIQQYSGSSWVDAYQTDYTFNGSNQLTLEVMQYWNGFWNDQNKSEYEYDGAGDRTLKRNFTWITSSWTLTDVDTTKYTSHREVQNVNYNAISTLVVKSDYTYDGSDNLIEFLEQTNFGSGYLNTARTVYTYVQLAVRMPDSELPTQFELMQNRPNPFNPETTIRYSLAKPAHVSITVFNILGQLVTTLEDDWQDVGVYETTWRGTDSNGYEVASGVYFYRLSADDVVHTRKMVLMR